MSKDTRELWAATYKQETLIQSRSYLSLRGNVSYTAPYAFVAEAVCFGLIIALMEFTFPPEDKYELP